MTAVVIGNGESRRWMDDHMIIQKKSMWSGIKEEVITWGCNAVYRDFFTDNLVAVDYGMQQEIYQNDLCQDTMDLHFANWSPVPSEVADMMFLGYDIPEAFIHKSLPVTDQCVISGKDPIALHERIEAAIQMHPELDMKDLQMKMEKDVGVWITYLRDNDNVNPIDFPVGWSAGNTALHLACQQGSKEIYILGFDLSSYDEPLNNLYKGTDNYLPSDAKGFNPNNWTNQMQTIFTEYRDVKFYWVDPVERFGQESFFYVGNDGKKNNVTYITKEKFCEEFKIWP
jgi:hypothetical protein